MEIMVDATQPTMKKTRTPKRPDPVSVASSALVETLQTHKLTSSSWLTFSQLVVQVPELTAEVALAALRKAPAKQHVILASKTDPNSLVLLKADLESVAHDVGLLKSLVEQGCSAEAPVRTLGELTQSLDKSLKKLVDNYWPTHTQHLPAGLLPVVVISGRRKLFAIHDERFPLPEVELSRKLIDELKRLKEAGKHSYPTGLPALLESTGSSATQAIRDKAIRSEPFCSQAIVSFEGDPEADVALVGDEVILAGLPNLLSMAFEKVRTDSNQVLAIDKIVKCKGIHSSIRPHFQSSIERNICGNCIPSGMGALKIGKKWSLFRLSDVVGNVTVDAANGNQTVFDAADFARDFDAAFASLDGKLGLPRYASLVDIRPALSKYPREIFDRELLTLRRSGRYSLSLVEGRFGLTDEERAACLVVDHVPHLLVHKK